MKIFSTFDRGNIFSYQNINIIILILYLNKIFARTYNKTTFYYYIPNSSLHSCTLFNASFVS